MNSRLRDKAELASLLDVIMHPKRHALTQDEIDRALIDFCVGCPDPVRARWLIVECLDPLTDDELVDRAMSMPFVPMRDVPKRIVPEGHRARALED